MKCSLRCSAFASKKYIAVACTLVFMLLALGYSQDQGGISGVQSIIVNPSIVVNPKVASVISPVDIVANTEPDFEVEVFVDKDPTGNSVSRYNIGERIVVTVRSTADAYIYLYHIRSNGEITQFIPNEYDSAGRDNYVQAGQARTFPPANARYNLQVDGPSGTDKFFVLASESELDVSRLASMSGDWFFTSDIGENEFARRVQSISRSLWQDDWSTDTALITIGNVPTPQIGSMTVWSSPSEASVYVDDTFRGYTPLSFRDTAGNHTVRVERSGYQSYSQRVSMPAGHTVNLNAYLRAGNPDVPCTSCLDTGKRFALVIGNNAYPQARLYNPINDATAIAAKLEQLGFEVYEHHDLGFAAMRRALQAFEERLEPNSTALVFFSGHGVQVDGMNYLIPANDTFYSAADVRYNAVALPYVLEAMENGGAQFSIVILDACRNNPFQGTKSGGGGLAAMDVYRDFDVHPDNIEEAQGVFLAFATAPGQVASDGSGQSNSPYTTALLRHLGTPNAQIEDIFKQVREDLVRSTQNRQRPWNNSDMIGDFFFAPSQ